MTRGVTPPGSACAGAGRLIVLDGADAMSVTVSDFGATLVGLRIPDRDGVRADVLLGFDAVEDYAAADNPYFGATVGRVANRISGASFELLGRRYPLEANEGRHHLHGGGARSFDRVLWTVAEERPDMVVLTYVAEDGEEGYPGQVEVEATFALVDEGLRVVYRARADASTPLALTNHAYWNLRGAGEGDVLGHEVEIAADAYTPTDGEMIPTGEIAEVAGTALDFRSPWPVGARIQELVDTPALGYDHNYLRRRGPAPVAMVARVHEPGSGRTLELVTNQPCLQFYSGNRIARIAGKGGAVYTRNSGLCLEPQWYPDAVNQPGFPSAVLDWTQTYEHVSTYRFSVV